MVIAGFLCALFGLVLFFIPVLAPILALVGLILSIAALCKRKDEKNRGLSIAGIVIAVIAIVIGTAYIIVFVKWGIVSLKDGVEIENTISLNYLLSEQPKVQSKVNYFIAQGLMLDESATSKEVIQECIIGDKEKNIAYDKASFELLPESIKKEFEGKVALKDSGETYYKISENYSLDINIECFVVDGSGMVYINSPLVIPKF